MNAAFPDSDYREEIHRGERSGDDAGWRKSDHSLQGEESGLFSVAFCRDNEGPISGEPRRPLAQVDGSVEVNASEGRAAMPSTCSLEAKLSCRYSSPPLARRGIT